MTAKRGIELNIREQIIERGWLRGVVSMPSNIFASTGTNVSVLFLDKISDSQHIVLIDASKSGAEMRDGKTQRTVLSPTEEQDIISAMNRKQPIDGFAVVTNSSDIKSKNYSFSAGQYFEVKIEHIAITQTQFRDKINTYHSNLSLLFAKSQDLESEIEKHLNALNYE